MLDENYIKIGELYGEISEEGTLIYDELELSKLYRDGYRNIKLIIFGKPDQAMKSLKIDETLFSNIKEIQGLPDSVVIDFLDTKGKLEIEKFYEKE